MPLLSGKDKNPANLANLSPEELKKIQSAGARAGAQKIKELKHMRDSLNILLSLPIKSGKLYSLDKVKSLPDLQGRNITASDMIMAAAVTKAMKGDIKAMEFVRDTSGQKVKEKQEHEITFSDKSALDMDIRELTDIIKSKIDTSKDD